MHWSAWFARGFGRAFCVALRTGGVRLAWRVRAPGGAQLAALLIVAALLGLAPTRAELATASGAADASEPAQARVAADEVVVFDTSAGQFEITLRAESAPATVASFKRHVEAGFYTGLIFHRIAWGFVIQGGGFEADRTFRPPLGTVVNESVGGLPNTITAVAMARQDDPDSADSQFYVNLRTNPHLDALRTRPGYTVFGHVTGGWDVIQKIAMSEVEDNGTWPLQAVVIRSARLRKPS